ELRSPSDAESALPVPRSPYVTRNLRDVQMSGGNFSAPQSFLEEPRRSHRFTQPLKPQQIARLSQSMPSDASRMQQSARHESTLEQSAVLIPAPYISRAGV